MAEKQRRRCRRLSYYEERPDLRLVVRPEVYPGKEVVEMQTSSGSVAPFLRWAKASFEVEGEPAQLTIYKHLDGDALFLPFADATTGTETYRGGRYLEVEQVDDGRVLLDFNYAYNPYCAFGEGWSCPLPPPENRLTVAIRAGERTFHKQ